MDRLRLPAEWEEHAATWLVWPQNRRDWPGKFAPIPWVYGEIVRHLADCERVDILVNDAAVEARARGVLDKAGADPASIRFHHVATDRGWARDSFPAFVKQGRDTRLVRFAFNGWAKYRNHTRDAQVPGAVERITGLPLTEARRGERTVVMEGGALDTDGRGTLLATDECLLDGRVQTRNPGFDRADYEALFREYLGISKVIWLAGGIAGDDTHGHVDDVCRFAASGALLHCREPGTEHPDAVMLAANRERLAEARLADGTRPEVAELPMPEPLFFEGFRLPASYANFYVANSKVLVPTFNDPADRRALSIIAEHFPGREVVGIHAVDLVLGLGTLHCLTHEQPA